MINLKLLYKIIGSLLFIETTMFLVCLGVAIGYEEEDVFPFACSVIISASVGLTMRLLGRKCDNTLSRRDAYLVVTLTWVVFSLFGTLPFLIGGYLSSFTDAFFETMSGFTTTGASIIDDVSTLPHGILFWRSFMQWIGGLGIVFFTIALLPSFVGGSVKVFAAEATGPIKTKLHPRLSTNAKWIWVVYLCITLLCIGSLMLAGMTPFRSINYSMATAATGGFAVDSDYSVFTPAVQYILTFFCFVSGVNFTLLYISVSKRKLSTLLKSAECRLYLSMVLGCAAFIAFELMWKNDYALEPAVRSSLFHVVSFITSTGLLADDPAKWAHVTWVVLAVCMFYGRRLQVHPRRHASEGDKERVPPDAPPQRRSAGKDRRCERAAKQARNAAGFPHELPHPVSRLLVLDDCDGHRQHQLHHHHAEYARQRRTDARS